MKILISICCLLGISLAQAKDSSKTKKMEETSVTKVYFVNLKDGQTIPTKYTVKLGVDGLTLRKAGEDVNDQKSGHHHILINKGPIPAGQVIPSDKEHLHFGQAQTETELNLPPGNYTLTLQFADGAHRSYGEKLSSTVKVTVK